MPVTLSELVRLLEATPLSKEEIIALAKTFPSTAVVAVDNRFSRPKLVLGVAMAMPGGAPGSAMCELEFKPRPAGWVDNPQ